MPFNMTIPRVDGTSVDLCLNCGEILFVLGANGTGKSSLMHRFYSLNRSDARRIAAHRQTWFSTNAVTLSPYERQHTGSDIQRMDAQAEARWTDHYPVQRANIAIYDLIDAENVRARAIACAVDDSNLSLARTLSQKAAPIKVINKLLRLSNMPIEISVKENAQVVASKSGSAPYSIAELSDGERNALLIAADVLTAKEGTLVLIDEPERHLHRSIISPLLTNLFEMRHDIGFVVSTHEVMLPLDNPNARTLLIRGCTHQGGSFNAWDVDVVPAGSPIGHDLRKDIVGARRRLLFIEGTDQSLDKALYSLLFPKVSVISKGSCRDVEQAVCAIRNADGLHWLSAFGVVDNDRRPQSEIDRLKEKKVYALSVFSVESIYYHPDIQRRVAKRHAQLTGANASSLLAEAKACAIAAIRPHVMRLSERAVERLVREEIFRRLPRREDISDAQPVKIEVDVANMVTTERHGLEAALEAGDLTPIISRYPVRETSALAEIAAKLGFQNRHQYEGTVRQLLMDDAEALCFVRTLFGELESDLAREN
jgi:ABC-type lipoprotein export system ATPase subunit